MQSREIRNVLVNLIGNAINYNDKASRWIEIGAEPGHLRTITFGTMASASRKTTSISSFKFSAACMGARIMWEGRGMAWRLRARSSSATGGVSGPGLRPAQNRRFISRSRPTKSAEGCVARAWTLSDRHQRCRVTLLFCGPPQG